ncbi:LysR family transcriptional regulator [Actinobacteria bacterium YIM 96077]|uniref:HTH lysR-type domain-containing protein n=1 Tax=Phytoactinopolyspora halophila TaxID=1981511 RepID=A0A329R246_9ACTN|nr:LysR family transcriptional regulator [Phytoactinopolyspora halophila]AYY12118.1 LysR family transcriptional regulator [Actinobacteria bacterium YIM 96077]RAW18647.1 hypothetical protein DPM12_00775 [Phytoactinopolyspora halophila]
MTPDERTLHYYRVVYSTGSIRSAARQLGLAPSAVSRKIAEFERRLGTPLLERSARGIRATEAGHVLARFAKERVHLEQLLHEQLDHLRELRRGTVRIASGEGFVDDLMNHALASFLRRYPGISVDLVTGGTDEIIDLLIADDVDIALALHAKPHTDVTTVRQAPQPLHVICLPGHSFATRNQVEPSELDGVPVTVLPGRFGLRTLTDQLQRAHSMTFDVRLVSSSIQAMVDFVLADLGVTLLPRVAVGQHLRHGRLCAVPLATRQPDAVRAQLLVRSGRTLSHAAQRLVEHCATHLASLDSAGVAVAATRSSPD